MNDSEIIELKAFDPEGKKFVLFARGTSKSMRDLVRALQRFRTEESENSFLNQFMVRTQDGSQLGHDWWLS